MRFVILCLLISLCLVSAHRPKIAQSHFSALSPQRDSCALCQFVISFLEQEATVDRTQIERKLAQVCTLLPSDVREGCQGFVTKYVDLLIGYISNKISPKTACEELRLCSYRPSSRDQNLCIDCQTAVFFAKMYLAMNSTLNAIEQEATVVCQRVFGGNYKQCLTIANFIINHVVNYIENTNAQTICSDLGLCATRVLLPKKNLRPLDSAQCTICLFVVRVLENELLSAPVQEQLADWIGQLCQYLPTEYQKECMLSIELALPQLLEMIVTNYPPQTLCTLASLCGSMN